VPVYGHPAHELSVISGLAGIHACWHTCLAPQKAADSLIWP
jgi:hypothetical protein